MFVKKSIFILFVISLLTGGVYAQTGKPQISEKVFEEKNTAKRFEITAKYPQIKGNSPAIAGFNETSKNLIMKQVDEFKENIADFTAEDLKEMPGEMASEVSYEVESADENLVSVLFGRYEYTGGAHPNSWTFSLNYDLKNNRVIELSDLFKPNSNYLKFISDYAITDLKKKVGDMSDDEWIQNGAGADAENYKSWTISKEGLKFEFDPYQVAAYAAGNFTVVLPFNKIPENMRGDFFAAAQDATYINGNPPNWCRNGLFPKDGNFRLAKIKGAKNAKIYFYGDDNDCPNGKNCRQKSYLIPGNELIVSKNYGDYVCAWYQPAKGDETVGWIENDKLQIDEKSENQTGSFWTGKWVDCQNDIQFVPAKRRGAYMISGNAIWEGFAGYVHVGEMSGTEAPDGNVIKIGERDTDEYACKVNMTLLGKYLIVSDNLNCGVMNVSFTGVYLRKK